MATMIVDPPVHHFLELERYFDMEEDKLARHIASRIGHNVCHLYVKNGYCPKKNCGQEHIKWKKDVVCKHWLRGLCKKNELCEFLHEYILSKMPECQFYSLYGECSNPECLFIHINAEEKQSICVWYQRGFCKYGPECANRHVKQVACDNYLAGFCPKGPECKFGHPKYIALEGEVNTGGYGAGGRALICYKCGREGHKGATCPEPNIKEEQHSMPMGAMQAMMPMQDAGGGGHRSLDQVTCYKCRQTGHYANKCPNQRVDGVMPMPGRGRADGASEAHARARGRTGAMGPGFGNRSPFDPLRGRQAPRGNAPSTPYGGGADQGMGQGRGRGDGGGAFRGGMAPPQFPPPFPGAPGMPPMMPGGRGAPPFPFMPPQGNFNAAPMDIDKPH